MLNPGATLLVAFITGATPNAVPHADTTGDRSTTYRTRWRSRSYAEIASDCPGVVATLSCAIAEPENASASPQAARSGMGRIGSRIAESYGRFRQEDRSKSDDDGSTLRGS